MFKLTENGRWCVVGSSQHRDGTWEEAVVAECKSRLSALDLALSHSRSHRSFSWNVLRAEDAVLLGLAVYDSSHPLSPRP